MGQYYLGYVNHNGKHKVFDNHVDKDWQGLKLMEHSWWLNSMVGNVVNDLFYNKGQVCWVGDYYAEEDYAQINCGKVSMFGGMVIMKNLSKPNVLARKLDTYIIAC